MPVFCGSHELLCKIHDLVGFQMSRLSVRHAMGTCIWEELHVCIGPFSLCARVIFGLFLISLISSLSLLAAAAEVKLKAQRPNHEEKRGKIYNCRKTETVKASKRKM